MLYTYKLQVTPPSGSCVKGQMRRRSVTLPVMSLRPSPSPPRRLFLAASQAHSGALGTPTPAKTSQQVAAFWAVRSIVTRPSMLMQGLSWVTDSGHVKGWTTGGWAETKPKKTRLKVR